MKICPTCSQTYADDTLNFCLTDGAVLTHGDSGNMVQPTIFMGQAPQTSPNQNFRNQSETPTASFSNKTAQSNWGAVQPQSFQPPRRKSRAGFWILGIIGGVVVVGVIGVIALVALIAISDKSDPPSRANTNTNIITNSATNSGTKYSTVLKEDFSAWRAEDNAYGKTEYRNNEYFMSSKQSGVYYVLITGKKDYTTTNASTKLTVRNVNGTATNLGYGLIVHSDPNVALSKDYVFLIDATTQSYRVAMHTANKESPLIKWTRFSAIKSGTQGNEIEVKDENGKMTFFINGQQVTTVQNTTNYKEGVAGIYAGDAIPVAFSNLQLSK